MPRKSPVSAGPSLFAGPEVLKLLAERMRPCELAEIVGQTRLLAAGKPLRRAVESGHGHSMILRGPPGCGWTTLALLLARYADARFRAISAVLPGLVDVRAALDEAAADFARGARTVLFVDEPHCLNDAVKLYINQYFTGLFVRVSGLPHCSVGANHA